MFNADQQGLKSSQGGGSWTEGATQDPEQRLDGPCRPAGLAVGTAGPRFTKPGTPVNFDPDFRKDTTGGFSVDGEGVPIDRSTGDHCITDVMSRNHEDKT